jgi:hypothetical protein
MDKLNAVCIIAIFSGTIIAGMSFGAIAFAQNTTTNTTQTVPQLVGQVTENTIVAWTGLLGVILTAVGFAIKVFHLDEKRYGKAITFTADALSAAYDERKTLARLAELGASEASPEVQNWLKTVAIPKANEWNKKATELKPKAEEAIALASKFGHRVDSVNFGKKFEEGDSPE